MSVSSRSATGAAPATSADRVAAGISAPAELRVRPFQETADLKDGRRILIREVRRSDRALIEEGFAHLSPRSRFLRFMGGKSRLSEAELDTLTDPTDHDDVALGALAWTGPGGMRPVPVGIARFVRLSAGADTAEVAVTVVDGFQNLGCGTALLSALARKARDCGVRTFIAIVHPGNAGMRSLAEAMGGTVARQSRDGLDYRLAVDAIMAVAARRVA